jgi:ribosomal-protein-alanine N-acetyltransferase
MDIEQKNEVAIRFIANFDEINEISRIDSFCFLNHCRKEFIERFLRNKNAFISVAVKNNEIVGFLIYYVKNDNYYIFRLAVHPDHRQERIATKLVNKLINKLGILKKNIHIVIKESNLDAQLFFKKLNFNLVNTKKDYFITYHDDLPCVPYIENGLCFKLEK